MSQDYETKTCSLCGSPVIVSQGEEAENVCTCPEAQHRREMEMRFIKLRRAAENCCGEGCEKLSPLHKPLTEDQLAAVIEIVHMISQELIFSAALTLADDTTMRITPNKCERKAASKYTESI